MTDTHIAKLNAIAYRRGRNFNDDEKVMVEAAVYIDRLELALRQIAGLTFSAPANIGTFYRIATTVREALAGADPFHD